MYHVVGDLQQVRRFGRWALDAFHVYLWESHEAMLAYTEGEIYASIGANPALVNVTATDFEVIAGPSKVTGMG